MSLKDLIGSLIFILRNVFAANDEKDIYLEEEFCHFTVYLSSSYRNNSFRVEIKLYDVGILITKKKSREKYSLKN